MVQLFIHSLFRLAMTLESSGSGPGEKFKTLAHIISVQDVFRGIRLRESIPHLPPRQMKSGDAPQKSILATAVRADMSVLGRTCPELFSSKPLVVRENMSRTEQRSKSVSAWMGQTKCFGCFAVYQLVGCVRCSFMFWYKFGSKPVKNKRILRVWVQFRLSDGEANEQVAQRFEQRGGLRETTFTHARQTVHRQHFVKRRNTPTCNFLASTFLATSGETRRRGVQTPQVVSE